MTTANDYTPLDLAAFEGHSPEPWEPSVYDYGSHTKQGRANAKLAAAAPQLLRERNELLAALKECATALDSYESSALIAEASALITRIEGQQ